MYKKLGSEVINAIVATIAFILAIVLSFVNPEIGQTLFWLSFLIGGYYKAKEGITDTIKEKKLNVELLMVIAAIASIIQGHIQEAATLIIIFAVSGALESYTQAKSEAEITSLIKIRPDKARVYRNGEFIDVSVEEIKINEIVKVLPGEKITADGIITSGNSSVDQSTINGESIAQPKEVGEEVLAGTMNLNGVLEIRVQKETKDSVVSKIINLVEKAQEDKPEVQNKIERIENFYVYGVLIGAVLIYLILQDANKAVNFLVIASPCAVVASVMPVILGAVANLAKQGIIVKSGKKVTQISQAKNIGFDKTGTITKGNHIISKIIKMNSFEESDWDAIANIEKNSTHPLAQAITTHKVIDELEVYKLKEIAGNGVEAYVNDKEYKIGKKEYIEKETNTKINEKGNIYVSKNNIYIAAITTKDELRENVKETIDYFNQNKINTYLLSGDSQENANIAAENIAFTKVYGNLLPDQKIEMLEKYKEQYTTIMVGDGINDGPVIATSDIGIAMGSGSDLAIETADIVLTNSSFSKLKNLHLISKRSNKIINQNLIFAFSVILILIITNFVTTLPLPQGVIGHEGSTIIVILNSLRIIKYAK